MLRRLPAATLSTLAAHALVLARAEGLLQFVAGESQVRALAEAAGTAKDADREALGALWDAVAVYGFRLEKVGDVAGKRVEVDAGLWRAAVAAGVAGGREEVRGEAVRALAA